MLRKCFYLLPSSFVPAFFFSASTFYLLYLYLLILKGTRKKPAHLIGLPAGSDVYMIKRSSSITPDLFMKWLKEYFVPRKGEGKVVLIVDGHASHTSQLEMLEFADNTDENNDNYIFKLENKNIPNHNEVEYPPIEEKPTPSKFLNEIAPVPSIPLKVSKRKQTATVLTKKAKAKEWS